MYINILQIKQLKQKSELDIERILKDFEVQSGCYVGNVRLVRSDYVGFPPEINNVHLDVKIK